MALKDNISLTLDLTKTFLKIDLDEEAEDELIVKMINAAANKAENIMNTDFESGEVPEEVEMWILKRIGLYYEKRIDGITAQSFSDIGITFGPEEFDDLLNYRVFPGF